MSNCIVLSCTDASTTYASEHTSRTLLLGWHQCLQGHATLLNSEHVSCTRVLDGLCLQNCEPRALTPLLLEANGEGQLSQGLKYLEVQHAAGAAYMSSDSTDAGCATMLCKLNHADAAICNCKMVQCSPTCNMHVMLICDMCFHQ